MNRQSPLDLVAIQRDYDAMLPDDDPPQFDRSGVISRLLLESCRIVLRPDGGDRWRFEVFDGSTLIDGWACDSYQEAAHDADTALQSHLRRSLDLAERDCIYQGAGP